MRLDPVRICRLVALIAIVDVLVNFYTGYLRRPTPTDSAVSESRVFRVSSSELFTGEMKRFEPHLGLTSSGCVRLEFNSPDRFITFVPEIWQEGKRLPSGRTSSRSRGGPVDASISFAKIATTGGKEQYRLIEALTGTNESHKGTTEFEVPVLGTSRGTIKKLEGTVEIPEGQLIDVWAYLVYKSTSGPLPRSASEVSFEEAAKGATWAVVFKVGWEEPNGR